MKQGVVLLLKSSKRIEDRKKPRYISHLIILKDEQQLSTAVTTERPNRKKEKIPEEKGLEVKASFHILVERAQGQE